MANTLLGYFKDALKKQNESTKYFNRDFLAKFIHAYNTAVANEKNGIDTRYYIDGVMLFHEWDQVYASDFYNKNSCAYCVFLQEWHTYKTAMEKLKAAWG